MTVINRIPISSWGGKSLILPDNVRNMIVTTEIGGLTLSWFPLESEIAIKNFNIYIVKQDTAPTSLKDFTKVATIEPDLSSYTITGLENNTSYYIVVESVSVDGYENASLRGMENARPRNGYWLVSRPYNWNTSSGSYLYYSEDGMNWKTFINTSGGSMYLSNGCDLLLYVEKIIYFLGNGSVYSLDLTAKSTTYLYSFSSGYNVPTCLVYTGKRIIASANKGNAIRYAYSIPGNNWVDMGDGAYSFSCVAHGDKLIAGFQTTRWGVYDFSEYQPSWKYYGSNSTGAYCEGSAYGLGRYILVSGENLSVYILEDNIKNSKYVIMTQRNSSKPAWNDVIYAEKAKRFVAIDDDGYTFYSLDGETWKPMNGKLSRTGKLSYGNGRFICAGTGIISYYCTDGLNWIAMAGINDTTNVEFAICSLYD